jgi:perosamine synthetase
MEFFDTVVTEQAKQNVLEVLNSGRLSEGEWVKRFEQELENQFGYRNCVAVNSGTSALHLALILAGVGEGDEVILPAQTFVATGLSVLYCGAKPVFADIGMDGNISVDSVLSKITEKTKAVIAVAWGGLAPDLAMLKILCDAHNLKLITDNAHALGNKVLHEDYACFSFQSIKQLTTGDGGMIVCGKDFTSANKLKSMRWFGISKDFNSPDHSGERYYNLKVLGYKYHMNNIAAAIGLGNLKEFSLYQTRRDWVAESYDEGLPEYRTYRKESTNWLYTILVERRDDFIRMMTKKGIPVSVVHVGIDRNDIFGGRVVHHLVQRYWDKHHICIPCHARLDGEDVRQVIDAIRGGW